MVVDENVSKEVELYLVEFKNGARAKLHFHDVDQILMVAKGKGIIAVQSNTELAESGKAVVTLEEKKGLQEGDTVLIPAFKWHWHGAAPGHDFAHYQMKKAGRTFLLE